MRKFKGFTLIELLVVISIIALLIGILLPALGAARRTARQMQNSTQVRGIHSGCVLFAQGNKSYYPGISTAGALNSVYSVSLRMSTLLANNYFTGEYMISPAETKTTWTSGTVTTLNFSYAMLDLRLTVDTGTRPEEWRSTSNSEAAVVSDRTLDEIGGEDYSIHTTPTTNEWRGSVAWNDNHVSWETDVTLTATKYGVGVKLTNLDRLFNPDTAVSGEMDHDCIMTYD